MAPDISLTLDHSEESVLSDDLDESGEVDLDDLDTPSENSNEFEWEDDLPKPKTTEVIRKGSLPEYTAAEEKDDGRRWRMFRIGEQDHRVDMKAIEPYKKVISHGGYYGDGLNAIVVFAVCFMPESNQPNYRYLMDNLFKYVIGTLELLVAENYMIVYLNGATTRRKMPSLGWLRKCYQQIDRSSKFSQKIRYVFTLAELAELIPMEYVGIPECIKQYVLLFKHAKSQQITPQLALQVLLQFDKAINSALAQRVRNRVNFRGSLNTYRFCDNVWTFVLNDVEFREVTELVKVDKVKIVACDGKSVMGAASWLLCACNMVAFWRAILAASMASAQPAVAGSQKAQVAQIVHFRDLCI
ncbi:BCL2/adenovirus E1B 19 kDa protein-interacting protein 2 [Chelonia mydas]|uniref:Transcription initiation factor IIA subunit 2 n=1 Tax=Chelonia mydas TaxID=8469 RepID=M7CK89_CHEMY|nr:BCL2/adenovirus E1B 19 kDa protein-interacting protein 2 [Chelonia mydas]